jgi:dehydrogenase/reductase SDR family protein 12
MALQKKVQNLSKLINFYGRFAPSFTRLGYCARLIPLRPRGARFEGQRWLVTGATGGIGRAAALDAARAGAKVFAVGRNEAALAALAAEAAGLKGSITPVRCDLASVAAIDRLAREWPAALPIDVLVNNVGILNVGFSQTAEGFESSYATNLLGHFCLTEGLVKAGALATGAAMINVVSGGMFNAPLNLELLDQAEAGYNGYAAYASHKRAQVALADHWRAVFADRALSTYAVHPGWADTVGVQTSLPTFRKILLPILRSPRQGADTIIWLAARRPAQADDRVWFDRKSRTTHAYPTTRQPRTTIAALVERLRGDCARALSGGKVD